MENLKQKKIEKIIVLFSFLKRETEPYGRLGSPTTRGLNEGAHDASCIMRTPSLWRKDRNTDASLFDCCGPGCKRGVFLGLSALSPYSLFLFFFESVLLLGREMEGRCLSLEKGFFGVSFGKIAKYLWDYG